MQHDVFICHASEDKDLLVRPLAEALRTQQIDVWYDEFSIKVGDSLRQSIDRGLAGARFGLVVLSPAFFAKAWTHWELDGLVSRMMRERRGLVLPLWHNVGPDEVEAYSPLPDKQRDNCYETGANWGRAMAVCCFCAQPITSSDVGAVSIALTALWPTRNPPSQELFAHALCLEEKFAPALASSVPFDAEAFRE